MYNQIFVYRLLINNYVIREAILILVASGYGLVNVALMKMFWQKVRSKSIFFVISQQSKSTLEKLELSS